MPATPRRVFLSYAWESDEYRRWVKALATRLRQDGVDARLDAWHLRDEDNIADFMGREVRLADWILILCSPAYRAKVHAAEEGRISGVGWEARLVSSRLLAGYESKILTALTRGSWREAAPDSLLGRVYDNLSQPASFEEHYLALLRRITGTTEQAPPIGPLSDDLETETETVPPLRGGREDWGAAEAGPPDLCAQLTLTESAAGGWTVTVETADQETLAAPFGIGLDSPESQTRKELERIRANTCTADDIRNVGNELWTRLLSGPNEKAYDALLQRWEAGGILKIRLALPPDLEDLPWEAIYDFEKECCLATHPLASLVRVPDEDGPWAHAPAAEASPLRILAVIPGGSSLRTSNEWEKIRESARGAGDGVHLSCLDGRVTLDRFAQELQQRWDVVHLIGHGRLGEQGRVELRFNAAGDESDEHWVSGRLFAQQFYRHPARLVVVNCCHAGEVPATAPPAAAEAPDDETLDPRALRGLGTYLARARVPAVLLMRYAIRDSAAADFSAAFYRELLAGERTGRVDLAAQEGRATLEPYQDDNRRVRSYISPVLYLAAGFEQLFTLPAAADRGETEVLPPVVRIDPRIDGKLLDSLRSRCCLPILGPGILTAEAERGEPLPASPGSLAHLLAERSAFPDYQRITPLTESAADWLTPVVFERICQHFESVSPGERRALNQVIRDTYGGVAPPRVLHQITSWKVPGIVYTYVDGLLERALLQLKGRNLRVVQADDLRPGVALGGGDDVLVNLRGSYLAPAMVLTEEDEDRLLDRIPLIAGFVADLMNRVGGCTLLFLGVSARDPLVRALARFLLRDEVARNRGTAFFVSDQASTADLSYWRQFKKLEWLDLDPASLIDGLSAAARTAEERP